MPNILLVNSYHYRRGGADVVFLEQAKIMRRMGWNVAEFAMQHPKNEPSSYSDFFSEEIEYGHDYTAIDKLRHAGKVIYSFEAAKKITALIEREKPDVVHAHNLYHHLSPSVIHAAKKCGVPVVYTAHDLKLLCPAISMLSNGNVCEDCRTKGRSSVVRKRCQKGSLALSALVYVESTFHAMTGMYRDTIDRLITPSRFFRDKFEQWGWSGAPIEHVPNFVDLETMPAPRFEPGDRFVYFGRLSREKGLVTLVDAAIRAKVRLRLVGTGPVEDDLRRRVEASGADVEFCGFRKGDELWSLVQGGRAVVLASEWYENAPLSILEGYACGKPVLGARIAGIPEMIRPGETGDVFESGSSDDLARVLRAYADLPDDAVAAQGRAARAWVQRDFTVERHMAGLLDVYRKVGVKVAG